MSTQIVSPNDIFTAFSRDDAQAFIDVVNTGEFKSPVLFPSLYRPELTFRTLQASTGANVAADVVAFNSRSPLKARPSVGIAMGEIPKIDVSMEKKETDINDLRLLNAFKNTNNPAVEKQIIDLMYGDINFVINAIYARTEWLAKQVTSTGKYVLTTKNNQGGVQDAVIDFGLPNENKVAASVVWDDVINSDPINDLKIIQKQARAKGFKLLYAITDQETIDNLRSSAKVQRYCASYIAVALEMQAMPSLEAINVVLRKEGLPQFVLWDSDVILENKDGSHDIHSGWEKGAVTFSTQPTLGNVQWTDTADGITNLGYDEKFFKDYMTVKVFGQSNPITVITQAIAYATPVLNNANRTFILNTLNTNAGRSLKETVKATTRQMMLPDDVVNDTGETIEGANSTKTKAPTKKTPTKTKAKAAAKSKTPAKKEEDVKDDNVLDEEGENEVPNTEVLNNEVEEDVQLNTEALNDAEPNDEDIIEEI